MENLKLIRTEKNVSLKKVQMDTGIDKSTLSKYETGKMRPTTRNIIILAKYFKTSTDFLLGRTSQQEPW